MTAICCSSLCFLCYLRIFFSNLVNDSLLIVFTGGSLTKIAYYSTLSHRKVLYQNESKPENGEVASGDVAGDQILSSQGQANYKVHKTARLHFIKFETKYIESCLDFIRGHLTGSKEVMRGKSIKATGGGAYKYAELIQEKLGLT